MGPNHDQSDHQIMIVIRLTLSSPPNTQEAATVYEAFEEKQGSNQLCLEWSTAISTHKAQTQSTR